ncbi:MAG: GntR family transcriptional regulator [Vampirovibrionales bacterium]|nr:GntR family transcriptional regulator [Vampirovibrionales bacterium]
MGFLADKLTQQKRSGALIKGGALTPPMTAASSQGGADYSTLQTVNKSSLERITIGQLPKELPDFKQSGRTKDSLVTEYLIAFIESALADGRITENHLLPRKEDLARFLGVSVGTVQNAIRIVEDMGYVESKQRIGTVVRRADANGARMRKQTSKRDQAVIAVKKFILDRRLKLGDALPSARDISEEIGSAPNTTRLALEFLTNEGILHSRGTRGNKANWELQQLPALGDDVVASAIESETLIDQLERDLKAMIAEEFGVNEKLPSHLYLSERFKVSIKTVHDAMRRLCDQGIIHSKRGRYGTFVLRKPETAFIESPESIFVPVDDPAFYNYEKVERHLKQLIQTQYKTGDKLPAMGQLAKDLDVSSNTIRKALQNLSRQSIVTFSRGRYGGTFVTDVPKETDGKPFTWVAINPQTIKSYRSADIREKVVD